MAQNLEEPSSAALASLSPPAVGTGTAVSSGGLAPVTVGAPRP